MNMISLLVQWGVFPPDVQGLLDFQLKRRGGGVKDWEAIYSEHKALYVSDITD